MKRKYVIIFHIKCNIRSQEFSHDEYDARAKARFAIGKFHTECNIRSQEFSHDEYDVRAKARFAIGKFHTECNIRSQEIVKCMSIDSSIASRAFCAANAMMTFGPKEHSESITEFVSSFKEPSRSCAGKTWCAPCLTKGDSKFFQ